MRCSWLILVMLVAGCGTEAAKPIAQNDKLKPRRTDDDKVALAVELLRQADGTAQYREALGMLAGNLARAKAQLSPEQRRFLESAGLTAAECDDLDANTFRPLDVHHLEATAMFHDAARFLEINGMDELEQARHILDWVTRHVRPHEQLQDGLPPHVVLRLGFGSVADRALVFLRLLEQFHLDGCLLSPTETAAPLVGLLHQKKIHLFDVRLGRAIPGGDGMGIATLDEAIKDPKLLTASKLSPAEVGKLEARIAVPIEALAPRMEYLQTLAFGEETAFGSEKVRCNVDALKTANALRAAGLERVSLWTPALRSLRDYIPVEDGGGDKSGKSKRLYLSFAPVTQVIGRYQQLHVFAELPPEAQKMLVHLTGELFDKYCMQPREMLSRGKLESLPRRLDRIRSVVEDAEFTNPKEEIDLVKEAAVWRERVFAASLAKANGEQGGAEEYRKIWEEDQYLAGLLQPDSDIPLRSGARRTLSKIILSACREPLGARANQLLAEISHDKAERADAILRLQRRTGKETKSAAVNARNAWVNARSAWTRYLDRYNLGPAAIPAQLQAIRLRWQREEIESALLLWENLHLELHDYVAAKLALIRALEGSGQSTALTIDAVLAELSTLDRDAPAAKELESCRNAARGEPLQRRLELLSRDWSPDGGFVWARRRIELAKKAAP